jgi:uncharacterized membrane protein YbhN (UPF0104 family)
MDPPVREPCRSAARREREWNGVPEVSGRRWKAILKPAIKGMLGMLVLVAVGRQLVRTGRELAGHQSPLHIDPSWLIASVPLYLAGLAAFGAYFCRLLQASPSPVAVFPAIRAYLISHLGKYVPGKAMVVLMRAALTVPSGARPATAAFATLYETLVMMATGGLLAAAGFAWPPLRWARLDLGRLGVFDVPLAAIALAAGLGFLLLVEVRVFPRLSALLTLPFPKVGPDALPHLSWRRLGEGILWSVLGWSLLGLSQVAVLRAILPGGLSTSLWPVVTASVALATVAGFAVPVAPGGLGVREWVLWTGLGATIVDQDRAVVAALLLRLIWVIGELLAAAVLVLFRAPAQRDPAVSPRGQ